MEELSRQRKPLCKGKVLHPQKNVPETKKRSGWLDQIGEKSRRECPDSWLGKRSLLLAVARGSQVRDYTPCMTPIWETGFRQSWHFLRRIRPCLCSKMWRKYWGVSSRRNPASPPLPSACRTCCSIIRESLPFKVPLLCPGGDSC